MQWAVTFYTYKWKHDKGFLKDINVMMCTVTPLLAPQHWHAV